MAFIVALFLLTLVVRTYKTMAYLLRDSRYDIEDNI